MIAALTEPCRVIPGKRDRGWRRILNDAMGTRERAGNLPGSWQDAPDVVREGWSAVIAGKPICVPGTVNKLLTSTLPLPLGL